MYALNKFHFCLNSSSYYSSSFLYSIQSIKLEKWERWEKCCATTTEGYLNIPSIHCLNSSILFTFAIYLLLIKFFYIVITIHLERNFPYISNYSDPLMIKILNQTPFNPLRKVVWRQFNSKKKFQNSSSFIVSFKERVQFYQKNQGAVVSYGKCAQVSEVKPIKQLSIYGLNHSI